MIKRVKNIPFSILLLVSFVAVALGFAAKGCMNYGKEISARENGSLTTRQMAVQDFVLDGMREKTVSGRPQTATPK